MVLLEPDKIIPARASIRVAVVSVVARAMANQAPYRASNREAPAESYKQSQRTEALAPVASGDVLPYPQEPSQPLAADWRSLIKRRNGMEIGESPRFWHQIWHQIWPLGGRRQGARGP